MRPEQGPLAGDPGCQLVVRQRGHLVLTQQPLPVKAAQPPAGGAFPVAACHPALRSPGQRPGPGDERRRRLAVPFRQLRSCRKHSPLQCRSPSQPGTVQRPGCNGRMTRGGGAASNSAQPIPAVNRARRQPSQRPDVRRVVVGHPGVRHDQAAVRADAGSPVNSSVWLSHSPARQRGPSRAPATPASPARQAAPADRPARLPAAPGGSPVSPSRGDGLHRPALVLITGMQVHSRRGQRNVTEQGLHHIQICPGADPARWPRCGAACAAGRGTRTRGLPARRSPSRHGRSSALPSARGRG